MSDKVTDKVAEGRAKAAATRAKRVEEQREILRTEIRLGKRLGTWGLGYATGLSDAFIGRALLEDDQCIELVKQGFVAVPSRTLKHAAWVLKHVPDISKLPVVASDDKLSTALLPVPETGRTVLDANFSALETIMVAMARKLPARKARYFMTEINLITGQVLGEARDMADDLELMPALRLENKTLAQKTQKLEQRLERLERLDQRRPGEEGILPPPHAAEGFRPSA